MTEIIIKSKVHGDKVVRIDDDDYPKIAGINWHLKHNNGTFYANGRRFYKENVVSMHRIILGVTDPCVFVDHIDRDGLNNQKDNLRRCTPAENQCNRRPSKNGTSKYLGVSFDKSTNKWLASLRKNNKKHWIGVFHTEEEAAKAYREYAKKIHGKFASSILDHD